MNEKKKEYNISIRRYNKSNIKEWDDFVEKAKNSLFMFKRAYMDYHSDRFEDFSLMFYEDGRIVALMPANIIGKDICSHAGLTFGGLIIDETMSQRKFNECVGSLTTYLIDCDVRQLLYKTIPFIYYKQAADEDRYALFHVGATLDEVAASTVINLSDPIRLKKGRKAQISRAIREGIKVKKTEEKEHFTDFFQIENEILKEKYNTTAAHNADEMVLLHERFPDNIHLFGGFRNEKIIAGVIVYEYDDIVHTQYMAASTEAKKVGALDFVIFEIMKLYKGEKKWLDFGISTENGGRYLNEGLISQKEGFGGRTVVFEKWRLVL